MKSLLIALVLSLPFAAFAQDHEARLAQIDVLKYDLTVVVDETDEISLTSKIKIQFLQPIETVVLDLVQATEGKGMEVMVVGEYLEDQEPRLVQDILDLEYTQTGDLLMIHLDKTAQPGDIFTYSVTVQGTPQDGLIISKNRHGNRTLFGDNWPDRAHHYFACVDHPSDKAPVTWEIHAPKGYQAVANGVLTQHRFWEDSSSVYVYDEKQPIPTKVMVFGMAKFAVEEVGHVHGIPVSSWVFPEDAKKGFDHYDDAMGILETFHDSIAPYAYGKLANVQSKTRYGGMENANTIFYYESSVDKEIVPLLAHELAHQWFGNMATEANWHHIWLSEGFATYFTDLYIEWTQGYDAYRKRMAAEREKIFRFQKQAVLPVINPAIKDYNKLLNANSYEKGAWVLHMLRRKVGYETFMEGVRAYYKRYQGKNALTEDFRRVMEEVSGQDLEVFFDQWLYKAGHPVIQYSLKKGEKKKMILVLEQVQPEDVTYQLTLGVKLTVKVGMNMVMHQEVEMKERKMEVVIDAPGKIRNLKLDPGDFLLAEFIEAEK